MRLHRRRGTRRRPNPGASVTPGSCSGRSRRSSGQPAASSSSRCSCPMRA